MSARILAASGGLAFVYLVSAVIGLAFAIPPGNATPVWPPSGISLAALLLLGPRAAPGVLLGATLANLTTHASLPVAAAIGCGNTLEALAGAWLLRRAGLGSMRAFQSASGAFVFAALIAVASAVAAVGGVVALAVGRHLAGASAALNLLTWWLGDIAGIVILTPFVLALVQERAGAGHRRLEAVLAGAALILVSLVLFGGLLAPSQARTFLYLPLFISIWLAMRFRLRELTGAAVLMTMIAVWGTWRGEGVFSGNGTAGGLLHMQLFMITFSLSGLAVFGTVAGRREAESAVLQSRDNLTRIVREKTRDAFAANDALRREVAERERLEEAERLRLATALESAGEGIVITDPGGTIGYVNPAFEQITGYSRDEVVGQNPRLFKSGRHDDDFYRRLWHTISNGAVWRGSFVDRKKDSSLYNVECTIAPVREKDGCLVGYVAVSRDVTDREQAERALRDSESRLRAILTTAADGIITFDESGRVESANPAASAIFGQSSEELIGCHVSVLLPHSPEQPAGMLLRASGPGRLDTFQETIGRRGDGTSVPLDVAFVEVPLGERRLLAAFMHDATERQARLATERTLLKATEELRVARVIQERFYPASAPRLPGFDIAGTSKAAQEAGGDFFDYLSMRGGSQGVVIGDVIGNGLGAALLMSQTRAYLHALAEQTDQVADLVTRLNAFLTEDWAEAYFVTLFLLRVDPSGCCFEYASAGHQCYLMRSGGEVEVLAATSIPLGIMPCEVPVAPRRNLAPGDLLLLTTDGIEEARHSGDCELGIEKVLEIARAHRHKTAAEIVRVLIRTAEECGNGKPQDDITAVVVKAV